MAREESFRAIFFFAEGIEKLFLFFSNRLGCLGSLLVSALITAGLLFLFGVFGR